MVAIFVALDESESLAEEYPAVSVGGFVSSGLGWLNYAKAWNGVLEAEGIDVFHATDFATDAVRKRHPVYKDWDKPKCEQFLNSLIHVINSNLYRDVGYGITRKVFDDVMTPARRARWGDIYYITAMITMIDVIGYSSKHFGVAPSLIIEKGAPYEIQLEAAYNNLCAMPEFEEGLRNTTFNRWPKGKKFPQTQAADFLVFNTSKSISHLKDFDIQPSTGRREIEGQEIRPLRYQLQRIFSNYGSLKFVRLQREGLEDIISRLEEAQEI
jgi:hypothetical protein